MNEQDPKQERATMDEIEAITAAEMSDARTQKRKQIVRTVGIVLAVALILAAIGWGIYGLVTHPQLAATLRDLFIIVLALVTIVIGLFLTILIFQLQSLIALLRDEIKPILESANQTVNTVRGTTTFVSDSVVTPMIQAASYAAAIRQTIKTLFGSGQKKKTRD